MIKTIFLGTLLAVVVAMFSISTVYAVELEQACGNGGIVLARRHIDEFKSSDRDYKYGMVVGGLMITIDYVDPYMSKSNRIKCEDVFIAKLREELGILGCNGCY